MPPLGEAERRVFPLYSRRGPVSSSLPGGSESIESSLPSAGSGSESVAAVAALSPLAPSVAATLVALCFDFGARRFLFRVEALLGPAVVPGAGGVDIGPGVYAIELAYASQALRVEFCRARSYVVADSPRPAYSVVETQAAY